MKKPSNKSSCVMSVNPWDGAIFERSRSRSLNCPEVAQAHESLTTWLNGENPWESHRPASERNNPESTHRILALFELVRRLTRPDYEQGTLKMWFAQEELLPNMRRTYRFLEIESRMQQYATVPYLAFQRPGRRWGVGQWPAGHSPDQMTKPQQTFRPYGEVMAAHGILELARHQALARVRQCECKRWYFAKREDGVACSDTCRKRIYDQKPEVKNKRKRKAKELDLLHKNGKVNENKIRTNTAVKKAATGK
jgi:hypothetical protein